ncbi:EndoU domain-containing protein [Pseudoscardovia radai]|uniref:EndoU domain-containing protein n=1 Tax=Pseudoscardovia radai TaxID=987066 RepID=UPI0039967682
MGTGESGAYYTSGGSSLIHHEAIIHAVEGIFTHNPRTGAIQNMSGGGHAQQNIDLLTKLGLEFHIVKTYPNGVRLGNVARHTTKLKRTGDNQAWFPPSWNEKTIINAGEYVAKLKRNRDQPPGKNLWGTYQGVRVGIKKRDGLIVTVFPAHEQPTHLRKKRRRKAKTR